MFIRVDIAPFSYSAALPCPALRLNLNGSVTQCSPDPVYGETCHLRCPDGYTLQGSKSRTCELSHNDFTVYWTGNEAICKSECCSVFKSPSTFWCQPLLTRHVVFVVSVLGDL